MLCNVTGHNDDDDAGPMSVDDGLGGHDDLDQFSPQKVRHQISRVFIKKRWEFKKEIF